MYEKKVAVWGTGKISRKFILNKKKYAVEIIFDNDKGKEGTLFEGLPVKYPEEIDNWKDYFIFIATSKYEKEIAEQLERYGMKRGIDFVSYRDKEERDYVPLDVVKEALTDVILPGEDSQEIEVKVRSKKEYEEIVAKFSSFMKYEDVLSRIYAQMPDGGGYSGYCSVCGKFQIFDVSTVSGNEKEINLRESVVCPDCHCYSRIRNVFDYVCGRAGKNSSLYLYEYITNTFKRYAEKFVNIIGSEYLNENLKSGEVVNGILHQDAMKLSFSDETFDYMVSNDVFEHVADYHAALREAYRCLKENGSLIFSVPFYWEEEKTVIRARVASNGNPEYLLPPVYHGNPLSESGSLVFTDFGWSLLTDLKEAGFSDAYAVVRFSVKKGHLGGIPIIFEAVKKS